VSVLVLIVPKNSQDIINIVHTGEHVIVEGALVRYGENVIAPVQTHVPVIASANVPMIVRYMNVT
jgi:hypothetical protein